MLLVTRKKVKYLMMKNKKSSIISQLAQMDNDSQIQSLKLKKRIKIFKMAKKDHLLLNKMMDLR